MLLMEQFINYSRLREAEAGQFLAASHRDSTPKPPMRRTSTYPIPGSKSQSSLGVKRAATNANLMRSRLPAKINVEDWARYVESTKLLFPQGARKFRWDILMMVLIVYTCFAVPFRMCMSYPAEGMWWWWEVVISLAFLADIILVFNTAYTDGDELVIDRGMIRQNYFKGWFMIDCLSSVPFELIEAVDLALEKYMKARHEMDVQEFVADLEFNTTDVFTNEEEEEANVLRVLRALRLVRMLRLLRLLRIQQYMDIIEDALHINLQVLHLVKVLSGVSYITHVLACAYYYVSIVSVQYGYEDAWTTTHLPGDAGVWTKYCAALFWASGTATGLGTSMYAENLYEVGVYWVLLLCQASALRLSLVPCPLSFVLVCDLRRRPDHACSPLLLRSGLSRLVRTLPASWCLVS